MTSHFHRGDLVISMVKKEEGFGPFFASKVLQEGANRAILKYSQVKVEEHLFFLELTEKLEQLADMYIFKAKKERLHECIEELIEQLSEKHAKSKNEEEIKNIEEEIVKRIGKELEYWRHVYLSDWSNVRNLMQINLARKQKYKLYVNKQKDVKEEEKWVEEIEEIGQLEEKIRSARFVLIHFYAIYSRLSRGLHSLFSSLAQSANQTHRGEANQIPLFKFYDIDGVKFHSIAKELAIGKLPMIKVFIDGEDGGEYPMQVDYLKFHLLSTFLDKLKNGAINHASEFKNSINIDLVNNNPWKSAARALAINHIKTSLSSLSKITSLVNITNKLNIKSTNHQPIFIIMGGGMGAGKTTIIRKYLQSQNERQFVFIACDEFKEKDPIYLHLSRYSDLASQEVHSISQSWTEELLVRAVRERKDVVFDGTSSWAPFIIQTVQMLRDNLRLYSRGPGYSLLPDGSPSESYWLPSPLPLYSDHSHLDVDVDDDNNDDDDDGDDGDGDDGDDGDGDDGDDGDGDDGDGDDGDDGDRKNNVNNDRNDDENNNNKNNRNINNNKSTININENNNNNNNCYNNNKNNKNNRKNEKKKSKKKNELEEELASYSIELMGVYMDAAKAVERAMERELETGRGVPLIGQLNSFKLFSQNFPQYLDLFDKITLFNNDSDTPKIIAQKHQLNDHLLIYDPDYNEFLNQQYINIHALSADQVLPNRNCPLPDPLFLPDHTLSLCSLLFSYHL